MPRSYTQEFKEETAKLVLEKGYTQVEAANAVGVSKKNLTRRVREMKLKQAGGSVVVSPEHEEIKRLRKENDRLKMEREILKKAAAFFANEKH